MVLIFFWIKIAVKRIADLFRSSPIIVIWAAILVFCFIVAQRNTAITLNTQSLIVVVPLLVLYALFNSLRIYDVMPMLMRYSKGKNQNKVIHVNFFIKRAFINNVLLIIFTIVAFFKMKDSSYFAVIVGANIFSLLLSFLIMYIRNSYIKNRIEKIKTKSSIFNPSIKSAIYDYLTSGFLLTAVVCIVLFLIVTLEFIKDINTIYELENPLIVFSAMLIIFSLGFMGITESISHINWKFQAIISPNDFKYHIKRTAIFLCACFGWMLVPFIFMTVMFDITILFRYLFCILVLFFVSIFMAFTTSNMLIKTILFLLITGFTAWISVLQIWFLLILIVPVIILFLKSKSEYREWSLL